MDNPKEFFTPAEAATELKLTPERVRAFCRAGRLGQSVGRVYIIKHDELERFKKTPRGKGRPRK